MGQFALFTYVRPFLETVTRVNTSSLSLILLTTGFMGVVGTLVITPFLNKRVLSDVDTAIPLPYGLHCLGLILTGHGVWAATLLLGCGDACHCSANGVVDMDRTDAARE